MRRPYAALKANTMAQVIWIAMSYAVPGKDDIDRHRNADFLSALLACAHHMQDDCAWAASQ